MSSHLSQLTKCQARVFTLYSRGMVVINILHFTRNTGMSLLTLCPDGGAVFSIGGWDVYRRSPARHQSWIVLMIGIQAIDWITTIFYLSTDVVTLVQVTTAPFLPILFIAVLIWRFPRQENSLAQ